MSEQIDLEGTPSPLSTTEGAMSGGGMEEELEEVRAAKAGKMNEERGEGPKSGQRGGEGRTGGGSGQEGGGGGQRQTLAHRADFDLPSTALNHEPMNRGEEGGGEEWGGGGYTKCWRVAGS